VRMPASITYFQALRLIAFLELVLGVGISHGLSIFFPYFMETKHNQYALRFPHFSLSDMTIKPSFQLPQPDSTSTSISRASKVDSSTLCLPARVACFSHSRSSIFLTFSSNTKM